MQNAIQQTPPRETQQSPRSPTTSYLPIVLATDRCMLSDSCLISRGGLAPLEISLDDPQIVNIHYHRGTAAKDRIVLETYTSVIIIKSRKRKILYRSIILVFEILQMTLNKAHRLHLPSTKAAEVLGSIKGFGGADTRVK
jgi:hypothetical protein